MSADDEGRLARWSRRKQETRRAGRRGGAAPVPVAAAPTIQTPSLLDDDATHAPPASGMEASLPKAAEAGEEAQPQSAPADLPAIEDLDANSDYSRFLADDVPEALTRAALRKLWLSDPVFANLDGLNDYDENFNLIDKVIQAADSNYRVGRGMLDEAEKKAELAAQQAGTQDDATSGDDGALPDSAASADADDDNDADGDAQPTADASPEDGDDTV